MCRPNFAPPVACLLTLQLDPRPPINNIQLQLPGRIRTIIHDMANIPFFFAVEDTRPSLPMEFQPGRGKKKERRASPKASPLV